MTYPGQTSQQEVIDKENAKEKEHQEYQEGIRPDFGGRDNSWTTDDGSVHSYWGVNDNPYDPDYQPLPDGGDQSPYSDIDLPPIPGGLENPGVGGTRVSVEALKLFGQYLTQLIPAVERAIEEVKKVQLRPGAFGAAAALNGEVMPDNKLKENTLSVLTQALDTLVRIKEAVDAIAARYKTAEELNEADANDLARMMNQVKSSVNGLKVN